ncbi:hypothetical protein MKMG_02175 [Methanogenium sp. MK-MG]|nr:hypothetical protein MKMG_02175 [Methanogenium sp. MK-MG]
MFNSQQTHTVCPGGGRTCGSLGKGDIHLDGGCGDDGCRSGHGNGGGVLLCGSDSALKDETFIAVYCYNVPFFEDMGGILCPDDCGGAKFTGDNRRVTGHAAFVGDDSTHLAHTGHHVRVGHLCDHDVTVVYPAKVFYRSDNDDAPGGNPR